MAAILGWQTALEQAHAAEIRWHISNHSTDLVGQTPQVNHLISCSMSPKRKCENGCSPSKRPKTEVRREASLRQGGQVVAALLA